MTPQKHSDELTMHAVQYEPTNPPFILHSIEWENEAKSYHVLNEMFLQAPACIALVRGPEHHFVLANPLFCQTVARQNLLGKRYADALPYLVGQGFIEILDLVYTTRTSYIGREVPLQIERSEDGPQEEYYFTFVYQPMFNSDGRVDSIFIHGVDITEQVQTRQQKDTFLRIVNHELKAPLTTALTSLQFAQRVLATLGAETTVEEESSASKISKIQDLLTMTRQQMEIQNRLIQDLLDFSSIQANQLRLQKTPCDLVKIVRDAVEQQQRSTSTHTLQLDSREHKSILLTADSDRIKQVINNYLRNAIKYSFAEHTVEIRISLQDNLACVQVQDEGPGLPAEDLQRVWERSYQGTNGKQMAGHDTGLGIGLYVCRMIIQQHQGQVGAENAPSGGAIFWFTLPLATHQKEHRT